MRGLAFLLGVSERPRESRTAQVEALCHKIADFENLPAGWAGEGAAAPSRAVIDFACRLLYELPPSVDLPQASPSAEGEIGLSWFNGTKRLEAMLQPDGHLVWVKRLEDRFLPGADIDWREHGTFVQEVANFYQ